MADRDPTGQKELQALLGRGTEFEGKLTFEGRIRVDGKVRGQIFGDDVLILGPSAEIRADIEVGTLIVRGASIWGEIKAHKLVELYAPSQVHGNIATAQLFLDKGVVFDGRCTMLEQEPKAEPKPAQDMPKDPPKDAADKPG